MWLTKKMNSETDWSKYFEKSGPESRKQRLIRECEKYDVTPYLDDRGEDASSTNIMRGVASEAEIERRLLAKKSIYNAKRANVTSIIALVVAILSMGISLYEKIL